MTTHTKLKRVLQVRSTDYADYGGNVERWATNDAYPDCSCGCRHFAPLDGALGSDWGVCSRRNGPRAGLLTFEHQAGYGCFQPDKNR